MRKITMKYVGYIQSPIGILRIQVCEMGLERIDFVEEILDREIPNPLLNEVKLQMHQYFKGERRGFKIPLHPQGTHFQMNVWEELVKIQYAHTQNYEEIARRLGDIKTIRAAANANGRNPIPFVIPCHRVIGKSGDLTGYSGGVWRKKWLLEHESKERQPRLW